MTPSSLKVLFIVSFLYVGMTIPSVFFSEYPASAFVDSDEKFQHSLKLLENVSDEQADTSLYRDNLCEAAEHLIDRISVNPGAAIETAKLGWLILELTRLQHPCMKIDSKFGSIEQANDRSEKALIFIERALYLRPFSENVLYQATLSALVLGDRETALTLLKEKQNLSPSENEQDVALATRLVQNSTHFQLGIPNRYPAVLSWSQAFKAEIQSDWDEWKNSYLSAVESSLDTLLAEYSNDPKHEGKLKSALLSLERDTIIAASTDIRSRIDQNLSKIYDNQNTTSLAKLYQLRSGMDLIPSLFSVNYMSGSNSPSDATDWKSPFFKSRILFETKGINLTVAIDRKFRAKLLILTNNTKGKHLPLHTIDISCSKIGEELKDIKTAEKSSYEVDSRQVVSILLPENSFRYCRVKYSGQTGRYKFNNSFEHFLRVYGEKNN